MWLQINDQLGRAVALRQPPQRIVSLVPSQTELLFDLGCGDRVMGRTKFCIHPAEHVAQVPSIGGTKKFRFDVIDDLQPDLIIGNREENYREGIEQLAARYPVWLSDICNLDDALAMIRAVGQLVQCEAVAGALVQELRDGFVALTVDHRPVTTAYCIWEKPRMVVGGNTFINDMLKRIGCHNPFASAASSRYPTVTDDQLTTAQVELILLSSEPFPYGAKQLAAYTQQFPDTHVVTVDGELFSWYGTRLRQSLAYFKQLQREIGVLSLRSNTNPQ